MSTNCFSQILIMLFTAPVFLDPQFQKGKKKVLESRIYGLRVSDRKESWSYHEVWQNWRRLTTKANPEEKTQAQEVVHLVTELKSQP